MSEERANRKLRAILSADAVGCIRLMQTDETWTIRGVEDSKRVMGELISRFKGRVVDAPGDNLLAEFASVVDATECAVQIQKELKAKNAISFHSWLSEIHNTKRDSKEQSKSQ